MFLDCHPLLLFTFRAVTYLHARTRTHTYTHTHIQTRSIPTQGEPQARVQSQACDTERDIFKEVSLILFTNNSAKQ